MVDQVMPRRGHSLPLPFESPVKPGQHRQSQGEDFDRKGKVTSVMTEPEEGAAAINMPLT
jgi:hypothetical protein